jgi:hypothetical protein
MHALFFQPRLFAPFGPLDVGPTIFTVFDLNLVLGITEGTADGKLAAAAVTKTLSIGVDGPAAGADNLVSRRQIG